MPAGPKVGIITNAGGLGKLARNQCLRTGLSMADLSQQTRERLSAGLLSVAEINNPVDVAATGTPEHFALALSCLIEDKNVDSILIPMVTPFFVDCEGIARQIAETAQSAKKPMLAMVMTNENWASTVEIIKNAGIPVYEYPETAVRVLAAMFRCRELRKKVVELPASAG